MLTLPGGAPRCLQRRLVLPSRPLLAYAPKVHLRRTTQGSGPRAKASRGNRAGSEPSVKLWRDHGAGDRPDFWAKRPQAFRRETHPGQVKANAQRKWLADKRPAISSLEAEYWDNLDELTKYSNLARRQKQKDQGHEAAEVKMAAGPSESQQEAELSDTDEAPVSLNEVQTKIAELKAKLAELEAQLDRKAGSRQKVIGLDSGRSEPAEHNNLPALKTQKTETTSGSLKSVTMSQVHSRERTSRPRPENSENGAKSDDTRPLEDHRSAMPKGTAEGRLQDHVKKQEPVRQLNKDEIAMFQRAAEQSTLSMPRSPVGTLRTDAKNSDGAISILEELFPRELSRQSQAGKPQRHVPKAPLDLPKIEAARAAKAEETASMPVQDTLFPDEETSQKKRPKPRLDDQLTVLILRKASKHLTQDDFQRLMPGGTHIEGWSNRGRLIRVIRARHTDSLELTGDYFLLFSNIAIASAYLEHTNLQHRHSKAHSPRSLYGSIPPPPSLSLPPGKKIRFDAPAYTYNLAPPSHDLTMRLLPQPFSPLMRQVVLESGYPELTANKQSDHEVLLWFTSYRLPSFSAVRRAIDQDGKQRGSFWQTMGQNNGIRILGADAQEAAARAVAPRRTDVSMNNDGAMNGDGNTEDDIPQRGTGPEKTRQFIVSFKDREEASRFVLAWHRRDVTKLIETQLLTPWRSAPISGNAELTW